MFQLISNRRQPKAFKFRSQNFAKKVERFSLEQDCSQLSSIILQLFFTHPATRGGYITRDTQFLCKLFSNSFSPAAYISIQIPKPEFWSERMFDYVRSTVRFICQVFFFCFSFNFICWCVYLIVCFKLCFTL